MTNLYFSLAIYFALAIALGFGTWLYLTFRKEMAELRKELAECQSLIRTRQTTPATQKQSITLLQRAEIIAMARRGNSSDAIAAKVDVPRNEIELARKLATFASVS